MLDEFTIPRRTLNWAKEAIQETNIVLGVFFSKVRTVEFTETDPQSGLHLLKVKLSENLPSGIDRRAFEAVSNIKNTFDQALFAAACAINKRPRKGDIHFPWRSSLKDLNKRLENPKSNIPAEFWDIIRNHKPYPTGDANPGRDDQIREIAAIANQKHTISISLSGYVSGGRHPSVTGMVLTLEVPNFWWDPVKNEMTLLRYAGDLQIQNNYRFAFHVVFQEAGLLKNVPALPVISAFAAKAEKVIDDLEAECRKIRGG